MTRSIAAVSLLCVSVSACGSGSPAQATFTGTVAGKAFAPSSAAAGVVTFTDSGVTSRFAEIAIGATSGELCVDAAANEQRKNATYFFLVLGDSQVPNSASPPAAGVYIATNDTSQTKQVQGGFNSSNATCDPGASLGETASGSLQLTRVDTSSWAGAFDFVLTTGEHVTGTFDAPVCAAIGGVANGACL